MVTEIRWSDNAIQDYNDVVNYLSANWNEEIALRFIELVEYRVAQIVKFPHIGMLSKRNTTIRSISITKHNRLYYQVHTEQLLEIVNIFDNRQHPDKNPYS